MGLRDERQWESKGEGFGPVPAPGGPGAPGRWLGPVEPGAHAEAEAAERVNFYADWLTSAEHADLAEAGRADVADEVALLRMIVRRAMELGDLGDLINVLRLLVATLKLHADMTSRERREEFDLAVNGALDDLSKEFGQPL